MVMDDAWSLGLSTQGLVDATPGGQSKCPNKSAQSPMECYFKPISRCSLADALQWRASSPCISCYATRTPPSVCATSLPSAPESLHARPTRELAGLCAHRRSYFIEGSPNRRVIVSRGVVNEANDKFFRQVRPPVCWHRTATGLIGGGPLTVRAVLCSTGIGPTT